MLVIYLANQKQEKEVKNNNLKKKQSQTVGKYAILDIASDLSQRINFCLIGKIVCRLPTNLE